MSSSISSECAFSRGGLTITKRWSRLKGDIVEATQGSKCGIQNDLLFREPAPSSTLEAEFNSDDEDGEDSGEESEAADDLVDNEYGLEMDTESDIYDIYI